MKRTKIAFLSWLLHHANRHHKSEYFYGVKKQLLSKYGKHIGYDVQHIEGKECWSCGGTGVYHGYYGLDSCYKCYNGIYKRPEWNILEVLKFGKYTFHQPFKRVYENPKIEKRAEINGYIDHNSSYWSLFSKCVLYCLYRWNDYGTKWTFELKRNAYRCHWFKHFPYNFLTNTISTIALNKDSYFYKYVLKPKVKKLFNIPERQPKYEFDPDDLPF